MTAPSTYALRLSDDELGRYRWMAARARAEESDLWTAAGIVPGARVADVGCGPGAMLVTLAELVGPTGHVIGVDAAPAAVTAARAALAAARLGGPVAPGEVRQGRAENTGLPKKQVAALMEELACLAYTEAKNGFTVPGLGKLVVVHRKARMGRNPMTGEAIKIPAKKALKFRIAKAAKDAVMGKK